MREDLTALPPPARGPHPSLAIEPDAAGLADAAALLRGHSLTILTGAGISTDSGIPDYRGPGARKRSPMTYQDFISSDNNRRRYWSRSHIGWRFIDGAQPNDGHRAVAALESHGPARGVITQNVDALHEKAGSRNVIDLHGRNDRVICMKCEHLFTRVEFDRLLTSANPDFVARFGSQIIEIAPDGDAEIDDHDFVIVDCPRCGGMLKPDVVFFGESVPPRRVGAAFDLLASSTALLVVGSSLTVHSGLRFARRAARENQPLVIINRGATRADELATIKLETAVTPALQYLVHALVSVR